MDDMRLLSDTRALAEALRKDMWAGAAGTRVDPKAPEAEQAALMWTLVSVLVAFFEDNGLVPERLMTQKVRGTCSHTSIPVAPSRTPSTRSSGPIL